MKGGKAYDQILGNQFAIFRTPVLLCLEEVFDF